MAAHSHFGYPIILVSRLKNYPAHYRDLEEMTLLMEVKEGFSNCDRGYGSHVMIYTLSTNDLKRPCVGTTGFWGLDRERETTPRVWMVYVNQGMPGVRLSQG